MTATLPPRPRRLPAAGPALWRAPTRAVRSPGVAAALAAAVALLVLAGAFRPLFVDSVGDAALAEELGAFDADALGASVQLLGALDADGVAGVEAALAAHAGFLGEPVVELRATQAGEVPDPETGEPAEVRYPIGFGPPQTFRLFARTGAVDHLPDAEGDGDGLWVPQRLAAALQVEAGDEILYRHGGQQARIPVAGTYRDLVDAVPTPVYAGPDAVPEDDPTAEFWRPHWPLFVGQTAQGDPVPEPPPLVGEPAALARLATADFGPQMRMRWLFAYPDDAVGVRDATRVQHAYERLEAAVIDQTHPLGAALRDVSDGRGTTVHFETLLEGAVERPGRLVAALDASLAPVVFGAQALAFAALLGLGVTVAQRRRPEEALLSAQGVGPGWTAARAVAEGVLPAVTGAVVGALAAAVASGLVGPGGPAGPATVRQVAVTAFAGALAALAVWAAVAVAARPRAAGSGRFAQLARRVPWTVLLVAAALAAGSALAGREGGLLIGEEDARRLDVLAVAFPTLVITAAAAAAARLAGRAGPLLRRRGARAPAPVWLAARGLAAAPGPARAALAATVFGVGLATFGMVAAASVEATIQAKAAAAGGGQTAVTLAPRETVQDLGVLHTEVFRTTGTANPVGRSVDVLAVDPETFADAAVWRDAFADQPLEDLLAALRDPGDRLPVLAVGVRPAEVDRLTTDRYELPVEVVASPRAFPGMAGSARVLVADRTLLVAAAADAGARIDEDLVLRRRREIWLAGDRQAAAPLAGGFHLDQQFVRGVDEVLDRPDLRATSWTLGYLRAAGAAAGVLVLIGLLGYAVARHRRRAGALALARRMGLSRRAARAALAIELGGLGLAGALVGGLAGAGAAAAVVAALDPLPGLPPGPLLDLPVGALALAVAAVPLLATFGALLAARAGGARVAAFLRDG